MKRSDEKIEEIEEFLQQLEESTPANFEEYKSDFKARAICERLFEKIVEALVDLTYLIIKEKKFQAPENDEHAFEILSKNKIISDELAKKFSDAKGMRNIIAHEYGKVNDELVYEAVSNEIVKDTEEFIKFVREK